MSDEPRESTLGSLGESSRQLLNSLGLEGPTRSADNRTGVNHNECSECDGTGWRIELRDGVRFAVSCECQQAARVRSRLAAAGIPRRYRGCYLDSFQGITATQQRAVAACRSFVKNYPAVDGGLLLVGPVGAGKTHLAVGILLALLNRGYDAQYFNTSDLLNRLKGEYARKRRPEMYERAFEAPVLLLDDIGGRRITDWNYNEFMSVIEHRYQEERITLATASYPDRLPAKDDEIWRRLESQTVTDVLSDRIGVRARSLLSQMCQTIQVLGPDDRPNREPDVVR